MTVLAEQLRLNAKQALDKKLQDQEANQEKRKTAHQLWLDKVFPEVYTDVLEACQVAANFGRYEITYLDQSDFMLLERVKNKLHDEAKLHAEVKFCEGNPSAYLHDLRRSYYYLIVSWETPVS